MSRKPYLSLLCGLILTFSAFSQTKFRQNENYREGLHIGYRADFAGYTEYKNVKRYYNEVRPWLEHEMPENVWLNGIDFGLGSQSDFGGATIFNFAYATGKSKVKGELPNGESFKRTVRINQITLDILDGWWTPIHRNGYDLGFGANPAGIMWCWFGTKYNGERPEIGPYAKKSISLDRIILNMDLYSSFHLDLIRRSSDKDRGIHFQAFYFLGWKSSTRDLILLNNELNPATSDVYMKRTMLQNSHFGIKTLFFI